MKQQIATIRKALKELELADATRVKQEAGDVKLRQEIDRLYRLNKKQEKQIQWWIKETQRLQEQLIKERGERENT